MRKFNNFIVGVLILGCGFMLGACVPKVAVPPTFFAKKGTVGLVWSSTSPSANYSSNDDVSPSSQGAQSGVIGGAIVGALQGFGQVYFSGPLPICVSKVTLFPLLEDSYFQKYGENLAKREVRASFVKLPLDKHSFKTFRKANAHEFWLDFREFRDKLGLDYVVYVDVTSFRVVRTYLLAVPVGAPNVQVAMDVYVIDTAANWIVAECHINKRETIHGIWDNPPEFPETVQALKDVLKEALEEAYLDLFDIKH